MRKIMIITLFTTIMLVWMSGNIPCPRWLSPIQAKASEAFTDAPEASEGPEDPAEDPGTPEVDYTKLIFITICLILILVFVFGGVI